MSHRDICPGLRKMGPRLIVDPLMLLFHAETIAAASPAVNIAMHNLMHALGYEMFNAYPLPLHELLSINTDN